MILLVFGSRTWTDRPALWNAIGAIDPALIIEGEAAGADTLARQWAQFYRRDIIRRPAEWEKYGRAAGPIRNSDMLALGPDRALGGIIGPLGYIWSGGSADMARKVLRSATPLTIIRDGGAIELEEATR